MKCVQSLCFSYIVFEEFISERIDTSCIRAVSTNWSVFFKQTHLTLYLSCGVSSVQYCILTPELWFFSFSQSTSLRSPPWISLFAAAFQNLPVLKLLTSVRNIYFHLIASGQGNIQMTSNSIYNDLRDFLSLIKAEVCLSFLNSFGGAARFPRNRSMSLLSQYALKRSIPMSTLSL